MAGIFAKMPMLDAKLVIFDTSVVDLSGYVGDPVQALMSIQLGGGTDIAGALRYCEGLITRPHRTMVVLVSDLCEGGPRKNLYGVARDIIESGAKLIALTALIPIVGAFIGCIFGAFFILVNDPMQAVWFIVMFLVVQQIEGNLIYPKVVGSSLGLPGIWVLAAVTVGGGILGIGGMLLGVPLAAAAYRILRDEVNAQAN